MPNLTWTPAECRAWLADKSRNPRTGRMIDPNAVKGVYKDIQRQCLSEAKAKTVETAKTANSKKANSKKASSKKSKEHIKKRKQKGTLNTRSPGTRYCDCLMHVRATGRIPYGICTNSVLRKYEARQPAYCEYRFEDYTTDELKAYATELTGRKRFPMVLSKKAGQGDRMALIRELKAYVSARKKPAGLL